MGIISSIIELVGYKLHFQTDVSLNNSTKELLSRLSAIEWFASVGKAEPSNAGERFVATWQEAVTAFTSLEYEEATQNAANELTEYLHTAHLAEYELWNSKVKLIRPMLSQIVHDKLQEAIRDGRCPPTLPESRIRYGLLHACMAVEYSQFYTSSYFERFIDWYLRGHFPCGWSGSLSEWQCTRENCAMIVF
jgi:hypothetical protein